MSTNANAPRIGWRRQWIPAHLRRRLLAAALAAAAAVLAATSLNHPAPPPAAPAGRVSAGDPLVAGLGEGQVAAPVRLVDPAVAALLHPGSVVDVLAAASSPTGPADASQAPAQVIAHGVRVISVPRPSGSAADGTATGSLVVLRVDAGEARALAGAEAGGRLSVVLLAAPRS